MKKNIKNVIPEYLLRRYRNFRISRFKNLDTKEVFTEIYIKNHWKSRESISGVGSESDQTRSLIPELEKLIKDLDIKSVLDIPCGDFKWMNKVNLAGIDYIGADIVDDLIKSNTDLYFEKSNCRFMVLNLIMDKLPKNDLIIIRDCLVHFSTRDIFAAIKNIKSSGCRYLLTTTFTEFHENYDIITGGWRRLNLLEKPFYFPEALIVINENCTEEEGVYKDKSMALWEINKIPLLEYN